MKYIPISKIPLSAYVLIATGFIISACLGRIAHLEQKVYDTEMQKDSIQAVSSKTIKLRDGTWMRMVLQANLERDSLDKALKMESKLRAHTTIITKTVHDTQTVQAQKSGDSLTFSFDKYQEPYNLQAKVATDGVFAKIDFTIKQDPAKIGVRLECGKETNGVRPANIILLTPVYMSANVDSVSQSKEVCSDNAHTSHTSIGSVRAAEAGLAVVGVIYIVRKLVLPLFERK